MVFSSVPVYLDPPNWHQQLETHQEGILNSSSDSGQNSQLQLPPPPPQIGRAGGSGPIRPNSMVDRARLAKLPLPEAGLKCPRCESTNTKFCYFNNYSLTQPRHFCKTCRRYWTRGGALRNVPVGGGCRRNKRSKSGGGSKSRAASAAQKPVGPQSTGPSHFQAQMPQLMASLYNLGDDQYGSGNFAGIFQPGIQADHMGFHMGNSSEDNSGGGSYMLSGGVSADQQWRLPFWAGLHEPPPVNTNLLVLPHQHDHEGVDQGTRSSGITHQGIATVKVEENIKNKSNNNDNQTRLNFSRNNLLGVSHDLNSQYWIGNSWSSAANQPSCLNSSSTSHLLL